MAKTRLWQMLGKLSEAKIAELNRALIIALDLPGQDDEES